MNYIKLLNAAFEKFYVDDRLHPTHISLYMALFLEWNSSRFVHEFYVNRQDLMRVAKIGSKSTYHRCITDLDTWSYISYFPSNNPYKGSRIKMSIFGTGDEPVMGQYNPILEQLADEYHPIGVPVVYQNRPINGQALVPTINNTKQVNNTKQPKDRQAVIDFFNEKGFDVEEGKKFHDHYEANNWHTGDGVSIRDWQALAINWVNRAQKFEQKNGAHKKQTSRKQDNLRTTKNKDYGQPL